MPTINLYNSIPIYYESQGSGKTIVFIHPPGMGLVTFKHQQPLSGKYRIITFDLRGNGGSGANSETISIDLLASDLLELIQALSIEKIVVCGYSMGGSIALDFALSNPESVEGIILLGGFSEVNTILLRTEFLLGINTVRMKGLPFLAKVLGAAHGKSKHYREEIEKYVCKANPAILYHMYKSGLLYKCTNRLHEIRVPTLLVDGENDFYLHSYQKTLHKKIQDSELVYIPKARHQIPTRHPSELNKIIDKFMQKL